MLSNFVYSFCMFSNSIPERERSGTLGVENFADWDQAELRSVNQRSQPLNDRRYFGIAPV